MQFIPPFDQIGVTPPGPWTNAAPQAGIQGSIVNADVFPAIQNEVLNVQDEAGLTRDSTNDAQLLQAIRSGKLTYFVDTGTADALVITPRTSFPSLSAGLELAILKGAQPNATTAPNVSVGGLTATFTKENGSALAVGDLPGNSLFTVRSDGTNLRVQGLRKSDAATTVGATSHGGLKLDANNNFLLALLTNLTTDNRPAPVAADVLALGRAADGAMVSVTAADFATYIFSNITPSIAPKLSQPLTLYVGSAGSDSNNGSTTGSAFLTIQAALNQVASYNLNGYAATINVGAGTFAGFSAKTPFAGKVLITGVQGATTISDTVAQCVLAQYEAELTLSNLILTSSAGSCLLAQFAGRIVLNSGIAFGAAAQNHMTALNFGEIDLKTAYTISGGAQAHIEALYHAAITKEVEVPFAVTLIGTPNFSVAFAYADNIGLIHFLNGSFSGSATGLRYNAGNISLINTGGSGVNFFPGNSPGTTSSSGGQYI